MISLARHQFAVIAIAAIALASSLWVLLDIVPAYSTREERFGVAAFENRFEPLRKALPQQAVVGYVSDNAANDPSALAEFYLTEYALVPAIVKASTDEPLVIGNFHTNPDVAKLQAKRLVSVGAFGNFVFLYRSAAAR